MTLSEGEWRARRIVFFVAWLFVAGLVAGSLAQTRVLRPGRGDLRQALRPIPAGRFDAYSGASGCARRHNAHRHRRTQLAGVGPLALAQTCACANLPCPARAGRSAASVGPCVATRSPGRRIARARVGASRCGDRPDCRSRPPGGIPSARGAPATCAAGARSLQPPYTHHRTFGPLAQFVGDPSRSPQCYAGPRRAPAPHPGCHLRPIPSLPSTGPGRRHCSHAGPTMARHPRHLAVGAASVAIARAVALCARC